ncbi:bublin coiled-coil protein [Bombus affinis]|uniref:Bublin coiled-coil protein n=1 Tax=Bombus terrestris TaxID=30195 RepID=A0A9B0CCE8_BOMTE|nr:bublin coiled-coil protein [Bombus terrestris]XP_050573215.1 bublin coiled-coil protein [Bombus affinis]
MMLHTLLVKLLLLLMYYEIKVMADENMVQNAVRPKENQGGDKNGWENEEDEENCNDAEFEAINAQLDQLNSVLDNLEQKNDDIRAELIQLLQSNREARKQFQEFQDSVKSDL